MGVGLWCIVAYLHPISIYYTLFFVKNLMNNEIDIGNLEGFLSNQIPGDKWELYYGERRFKCKKKTKIKRWIFVACVNAPAWRKDWFYQIIDPVLRSALDLQWSKWPRHSWSFELNKGKNKWQEIIKIPGLPDYSYQLYGMPVPKRKGDLLKCYFKQPAREWWEMV